MIYIATQPDELSRRRTTYFEGTLAHEFQHMIHWNVHTTATSGWTRAAPRRR